MEKIIYSAHQLRQQRQPTRCYRVFQAVCAYLPCALVCLLNKEKFISNSRHVTHVLLPSVFVCVCVCAWCVRIPMCVCMCVRPLVLDYIFSHRTQHAAKSLTTAFSRSRPHLTPMHTHAHTHPRPTHPPSSEYGHRPPHSQVTHSPPTGASLNKLQCECKSSICVLIRTFLRQSRQAGEGNLLRGKR